MTSPNPTEAQLSPTQQKVLRRLGRQHAGDHGQIAGHGMAPYLSAARALARKGLAITFRTGCYHITPAGRAVLEAH